jgi:hypothetical protein
LPARWAHSSLPLEAPKAYKVPSVFPTNTRPYAIVGVA